MPPNTDLKRSRFNPWLITLGCFGSSALLITTLANTSGMFITPVMEESGWSRTATFFYFTIFAWVAAILQPIVARIIEKYDARIIMTVVVILFCGSYVWSASFNALWQWNVFGVIFGISAAFFMYLIQPVLTSRWFKKRMAFALSLVGVYGGIIGFFVNPWVQTMIEDYGWRTARLWVGVVTLVLALTLTVAFVRTSPEKMGMLPYGAEENEESELETTVEGVPTRTALRSVSFALFLVFGLFSVLIPSMNQHLPSYAASAPIGAMAGAFALSILSIISLPRNPIAGWFYDLVNSKVGNIVSYALSGLGILLIILGRGESAVLFYIGVALWSTCFIPLTMGTPVMVREIFGQLSFTKLYSYVTITVLVGGGLAPLLYSTLYDLTGGYSAMLWVALSLCVLQILLVPITAKSGKRLARDTELVPVGSNR